MHECSPKRWRVVLANKNAGEQARRLDPYPLAADHGLRTTDHYTTGLCSATLGVGSVNAVGRMFWLTRNRFVGSKRFFSATSRS